jgi:hypothetical protein
MNNQLAIRADQATIRHDPSVPLGVIIHIPIVIQVTIPPQMTYLQEEANRLAEEKNKALNRIADRLDELYWAQ